MLPSRFKDLQDGLPRFLRMVRKTLDRLLIHGEQLVQSNFPRIRVGPFVFGNLLADSPSGKLPIGRLQRDPFRLAIGFKYSIVFLGILNTGKDGRQPCGICLTCNAFSQRQYKG